FAAQWLGSTLSYRAVLHGAADVDHFAQFRGLDISQVEEMPDMALAHPTAPRSGAAASTRFTRAQARSILPIASPISASETLSGGSKRTTLSPAPTVRNFSARNASTSSVLDLTARNPINKPSPRTSAIRSE